MKKKQRRDIRPFSNCRRYKRNSPGKVCSTLSEGRIVRHKRFDRGESHSLESDDCEGSFLSSAQVLRQTQTTTSDSHNPHVARRRNGRHGGPRRKREVEVEVEIIGWKRTEYGDFTRWSVWGHLSGEMGWVDEHSVWPSGIFKYPSRPLCASSSIPKVKAHTA